MACYMKWKGGFKRPLNKPKGCSLRRSEPRGPIKGCEDTCQAFEACVELTRQEKAEEELLVKQLERLDKLGRESLNPVGDS